jgi:ankyrin repeat protein
MALFRSKGGFLEAAAKGDVAAIKDYLAHGAADWLAVREKKTGENAFHKAAQYGRAEVIRLLLAADNNGAAVAGASNGSSPLYFTVSGQQREAVKALLESEKVLGTAQSFPLVLAIERKAFDIFKDLAATGRVDFPASRLPLVYKAVLGRNPDFVKFLLDAGANPNVPLMRRERWEHRDAFLAVYNESNDRDSPASALYAAAAAGNLEIARMLVDKGAMLAAAELPLLNAAKDGNLEMARLLLDHELAQVNAQSHTGRSALHFAAQENKADMIRFLLQRGADPTLADKSGATPITVAQQFCLRDVIDMMTAKTPQAILTTPTPNSDKTRTPPQAAAETAVEARPAASPAGDGAETWTLSGKIVLAHALQMPEIRRSLTTIFNFESRERLIITENLALKTETMSRAESFDEISEDSLKRAFAEYKRLGGTHDEADVFRNRVGKLTAKPG